MKLFNRIFLMLLCSILTVMLYVKTPDLSNQPKKLSETKVILVNEDEGVVISDVHYNLAQNLVDVFVEESQFDATTSNFANAYKMLENNEVMYVIVFNKDFSRNVNNFDTVNPVNGSVTYYYNHTYQYENIYSENERNRIFNELQNQLSTVYTKTIISELQGSKEQLDLNLTSLEELIAAVKLVNDTNKANMNTSLSNTNGVINGFTNEMGEKIGTFGQTIDDSRTLEETVISNGNETIENVNSGLVTHETFRSSIESNYGDYSNNYIVYSDLLVGTDGVITKVKDYYVPVYQNFDLQYQSNIDTLGMLIDLDKLDIYGVCTSEYNEDNFTEIRTYLAGLEISVLNLEDNTIVVQKLLTDAEIDQVIAASYEICVTDYDNKYNLGNASTLNNLYISNKTILLNEIKEESTVPLSTFQNESIITTVDIGEPVPAGNTILTQDKINEFNSFNQLIAILAEQDTYVSITYDATKQYYMNNINHTNFEALKTLIRNEYENFGGNHTFINILNATSAGTVNLFYGLDTFNTIEGTTFEYFQLEKADVSLEELALLQLADRSFYHHLETEVVSIYSDKFFATTDGRSASDINDELITFITANEELSTTLLETYQEEHNTNLAKLNEDSILIVTNYEDTSTLTTSTIERGTIILSNYDKMDEQTKIIREENSEITKNISEIKTKNTEAIAVVNQSYTDFDTAVTDLELANEEQQAFIDEYAMILNNANVDGVSNQNFYSFINNPIEFNRESVNDDVSMMNSYFIILWLFVGILLLNAIYSIFSNTLTLNFGKDSFKTNKLIEIINKYLVYSIISLMFMIVYSIVLINKFDITDKLAFMMQLLVISILINFILGTLVKINKFIGYSIYIFFILVMYIVLFSESLSMIERVLAAPIITLDNFLKVYVYNVDYSNAFIYSISLYAVILITLVCLGLVLKRFSSKAS